MPSDHLPVGKDKHTSRDGNAPPFQWRILAKNGGSSIAMLDFGVYVNISHLPGFYQKGATRNPQRRIYEKLPKAPEIPESFGNLLQLRLCCPYGELLRFDSPQRRSE